MGFSDKTPEYQACLKFLEAISPKSTDKKNEENWEEIIDLTSPVDSPDNNEILFLELKKTKKAADSITDNKTHEELETQEYDNDNNEETKEKENKQC